MECNVVERWTFDHFLKMCTKSFDEGTNNFGQFKLLLDLLLTLCDGLEKSQSGDQLKLNILLILETIRDIKETQSQDLHFHSDKKDILLLIQKLRSRLTVLKWVSDSGYLKDLDVVRRCSVFLHDLIIKCMWSLWCYQIPEDEIDDFVSYATDVLKEMAESCSVAEQHVYNRCSKLVDKFKEQSLDQSASQVPIAVDSNLIPSLEGLVSDLQRLLPKPFLEKVAAVTMSSDLDSRWGKPEDVFKQHSTLSALRVDSPKPSTSRRPLHTSSPRKSPLKPSSTKTNQVSSPSASSLPKERPHKTNQVSSPSASSLPKERPHKRVLESSSPDIVDDSFSSNDEEDQLSAVAKIIKKSKEFPALQVNIDSVSYVCKPPSHNTYRLGKWLTPEEDQLIVETLRIGEGNWAEIKEATGSQRSTQQIKDKWRHLKKFPSRIQSVVEEKGLQGHNEK